MRKGTRASSINLSQGGAGRDRASTGRRGSHRDGRRFRRASLDAARRERGVPAFRREHVKDRRVVFHQELERRGLGGGRGREAPRADLRQPPALRRRPPSPPRRAAGEPRRRGASERAAHRAPCQQHEEPPREVRVVRARHRARKVGARRERRRPPRVHRDRARVRLDGMVVARRDEQRLARTEHYGRRAHAGGDAGPAVIR
mmetsp:Transcript_21839/g.75082  ORF Transcript_21839/g.75082 Transcript_21839/m.75082 type:complete len:202 (+) Transcript_21839:405-1010(+)